MSQRVRTHPLWRNPRYWLHAFHAQITEEARTLSAGVFKKQREQVMFVKIIYIVELMQDRNFNVPKEKVIRFIKDILNMRLFGEEMRPLVEELIPQLEMK